MFSKYGAAKTNGQSQKYSKETIATSTRPSVNITKTVEDDNVVSFNNKNKVKTNDLARDINHKVDTLKSEDICIINSKTKAFRKEATVIKVSKYGETNISIQKPTGDIYCRFKTTKYPQEQKFTPYFIEDFILEGNNTTIKNNMLKIDISMLGNEDLSFYPFGNDVPMVKLPENINFKVIDENENSKTVVGDVIKNEKGLYTIEFKKKQLDSQSLQFPITFSTTINLI